MCADGAHTRALLDAWRAERLDRRDPLRFGVLDALERRARRHDGEVRRLLDAKLARLVEAYAEELQDAGAEAAPADRRPAPDGRAGGALGALLAHLAASTLRDGPAPDPDAGAAAALPELPALGEFRRLWARVRTDGQLRQALEQVPGNGGPLNSGVLAHRAIVLMRELSPGYLQHFLSYADTLSWMEQMQQHGVLGANAARPPGARGAPQRKLRTRRG